MKNAVLLGFILSTLLGTSAGADERAEGYVGGDCYGTVICSAGGQRTCQTDMYAVPTAYRSLCTRHFGSSQAFVRCDVFNDKNEVLKTETLNCP